MVLYPLGTTPACAAATAVLKRAKIPLIDHPAPEITHLMLDVPSFRPDGQLRDGSSLERILRMLPPNVHIIGGNLNPPFLTNYTKTDLLADPGYLARNAAITADCALRLAGREMDRTFGDSHALVIGWGRIGKCLSQLLKQAGSTVTVAVRKETDLAMASALGFQSIPIPQIADTLHAYSLIFNTVPSPILDIPVPAGCIALELASTPGLPEENVIPAKGLPGVYAPQSSGKLIADSILYRIKEGLL